MNSPSTSIFEASRPSLFRLAYRMLGERGLAEDVVQDCWLRWREADHARIEKPAAWLTTVATRLALDALRKAKARRETYIGPWLPEPLLAGSEDTGATLELADELSIALLHMLERLSPEERAALVLREAFDFDYKEIAAILGRSEVACRKLVSRAKLHVRSSTRARPVSRAEHEALLGKFMSAVALKDAKALAELFRPDAVAYTDGGGVVLAARNPIRGRDKIVRFLLGLAAKKSRTGATRAEIGTVNAEPAIFLYEHERLDTVYAIAIETGTISALFAIRNPHKLHPPALREANARC
ncbi:MAG: RNA polymerase sigma factor SigJ [Alphaproteobacteria bacterium]|nr:RNA polymerase sigma factor SigJ [Alphaproteobacteria bacterium]